MFLKNKNIIFKIRRSKVTDYAALRLAQVNLHSVQIPLEGVVSNCNVKWQNFFVQ